MENHTYITPIFVLTNESTSKGAKVSLMFSGLISGGSVPGKYTDYNGEVHFNIGTGNGTIYVNGRDAKTGYISGMEVVYV